MDTTTIQVSEAVADELYALKARGESYDDVLRRELGLDADRSAGHVSIPDSVPERIDRAEARAAIAAVLELVDANGGVQRQEIIDAVAPEHPLGYDEIGERGAWWRKTIRPALEDHAQYENGVGWVPAGEQ
jgi:hypothetical protein